MAPQYLQLVGHNISLEICFVAKPNTVLWLANFQAMYFN